MRDGDPLAASDEDVVSLDAASVVVIVVAAAEIDAGRVVEVVNVDVGLLEFDVFVDGAGNVMVLCVAGTASSRAEHTLYAAASCSAIVELGQSRRKQTKASSPKVKPWELYWAQRHPASSSEHEYSWLMYAERQSCAHSGTGWRSASGITDLEVRLL